MQYLSLPFGIHDSQNLIFITAGSLYGTANTLPFVHTSKGHTWGCMAQITLYL